MKALKLFLVGLVLLASSSASATPRKIAQYIDSPHLWGISGFAVADDGTAWKLVYNMTNFPATSLANACSGATQTFEQLPAMPEGRSVAYISFVPWIAGPFSVLLRAVATDGTLWFLMTETQIDQSTYENIRSWPLVWYQVTATIPDAP